MAKTIDVQVTKAFTSATLSARKHGAVAVGDRLALTPARLAKLKAFVEVIAPPHNG